MSLCCHKGQLLLTRDSATDQNAQLVALLHEVASRLDDDEKRRVTERLEGVRAIVSF